MDRTEKIVSAASPAYASEDGSRIDLLVTFDDIGTVPFTADINDVELHSIELHKRAMAGEYGPIGPYVPKVFPPLPPSLEDIEANLATIKDLSDKNNALTSVVNELLARMAILEQKGV